MRKISTLLMGLMFFIASSKAQFQKNDVILGGSVSFGTNKTSPTNGSSGEVKNTNTGFNIAASRFVSGNAFNTLGLVFSTQHSKQDNGFGSISVNSGSTGGLSFGHTRLSPLSNRFYLSFPLNFLVSSGRNKSEVNGNKIRSDVNTSLSVSGGIGLIYQTKKRLLLTCTLPGFINIGFNHRNIKDFGTAGQVTSTAKNTGFSLSGGLTSSSLNNLSIGIGFLIREK